MSQRAQDRLAPDPNPPREPSWRDYWWRPRVGFIVAGRAVPHSWHLRLPRLLCRSCHEWTGHNWRLTCGRFTSGCDHRHHDLEIWFA